MMRTLMGKDWLLYRGVFLGSGIAILALFICIVIFQGFVTEIISRAVFWHPALDHSRIFFIDRTITPSVQFLILTAAAVGGISLATERRDGSANYLGMMPVSRMRIIFSKLSVAAIGIGIFCVVNILMMGVIALGHPMRTYTGFSSRLLFIRSLFEYRYELLLIFAAFSIAWGIGAVVTSPAISSGTAIFLTFGVSLIFREVGLIIRYTEIEIAHIVMSWALGIGTLSLLVGTVVYIRRVEP